MPFWWTYLYWLWTCRPHKPTSRIPVAIFIRKHLHTDIGAHLSLSVMHNLKTICPMILHLQTVSSYSIGCIDQECIPTNRILRLTPYHFMPVISVKQVAELSHGPTYITHWYKNRCQWFSENDIYLQVTHLCLYLLSDCRRQSKFIFIYHFHRLYNASLQ